MTPNAQPPPPRAPSPLAPPEPDSGKPTDNPIAVAGLLISLLGVIASVAVIGGFIGMVGVILATIGLKRSKVSGRGKGVAIGGIALGLFSILASIGFFALYFTRIDGGPEIVKDGIATHSTNTEFPPQDDYVGVDCEAAGSSSRATIELKNLSPAPSLYVVTVTWDTVAGGTTENVVQSELVNSDDTTTLRLFAESSEAVPDTCRVTTIERSGLSFLEGID